MLARGQSTIEERVEDVATVFRCPLFSRVLPAAEQRQRGQHSLAGRLAAEMVRQDEEVRHVQLQRCDSWDLEQPWRSGALEVVSECRGTRTPSPVLCDDEQNTRVMEQQWCSYVPTSPAYDPTGVLGRTDSRVDEVSGADGVVQLQSSALVRADDSQRGIASGVDAAVAARDDNEASAVQYSPRRAGENSYQYYYRVHGTCRPWQSMSDFDDSESEEDVLCDRVDTVGGEVTVASSNADVLPAGDGNVLGGNESVLDDDEWFHSIDWDEQERIAREEVAKRH